MNTPAIARLGVVLLGAFLPIATNAAPANADISQCASGYMCVWSGESYSGTVKRISVTSSYQSTGLTTIGSFYNHRTRRTYYHEKSDGSGNYVCLAVGAKSATPSGWKTHAKAVYLSTVTSC